MEFIKEMKNLENTPLIFHLKERSLWFERKIFKS